MKTLRIKYTKTDYMKYLGHLELMKLFERVFRYEKMPLKYSEGFNPIPKLTFAAPLSVGYASESDIMEVQLVEEVPLDKVLGIKMPRGIVLIDARYVTCKKSLMAGVEYAAYDIVIKREDGAPLEVGRESFEAFVGQEEILYEKKTKKGKIKMVDMREQMATASVVEATEGRLHVKAVLMCSSAGSLNPDRLIRTFLKACSVEGEVEMDVTRRGLFYMKDNKMTDLFALEDGEQS